MTGTCFTSRTVSLQLLWCGCVWGMWRQPGVPPLPCYIQAPTCVPDMLQTHAEKNGRLGTAAEYIASCVDFRFLRFVLELLSVYLFFLYIICVRHTCTCLHEEPFSYIYSCLLAIQEHLYPFFQVFHLFSGNGLVSACSVVY